MTRLNGTPHPAAEPQVSSPPTGPVLWRVLPNDSGPFREVTARLAYDAWEAAALKDLSYADALVISLWPSRGIWFAGVEVKVSRQDWLRELDQPTKAAEIQRYCNYWWVAAPEGIVDAGEVPETWGLYCVSGKRAKIVKPAPPLSPEPLSIAFVASVMRNASQSQDAVISAAKTEAYNRAAEEYGDGKKNELQQQVYEAQAKVRDAERDTQHAKRAHEELRHVVEEFERHVGTTGLLSTRGFNAGKNIAEQYKLALLLARHRPEELASKLAAAAEALRKLPGAAE